MSAYQRRKKIIEILEVDGYATVVQLAEIFEISQVTIRHDLEKLETEGQIIREHGGASPKKVEDHVNSFSRKNQENLDAKRVIGRKAAEQVKKGDVIILDAGTTCTEIAKQLIGRTQLTVITSALNIAFLLGAEEGIDLILIGGNYSPLTLSVSGRIAANFFKHIHVNKLFLTTAGISPNADITYSSLNDIILKKAMIEAADKVYLVSDSSKIGRNAFASLGALSIADYIITDTSIDACQSQIIHHHPIELIFAE